ncbi:hypothetical protein IAR55_000746 [Kwoniella newhampshirensis]|uniref:PHD-type domain-containing protein n=1 Tax=Kwoniella newhampshirensis TaxID=1651941 RepID=A0AAW0Z3U2_9TREE
MPRKLPPPAAVAPIEALSPPSPPSPIIQTLRKDWRWAAISQFMWTFSDAFGLVDWDIEALEADFDGEETALIPTLVAKLLFALTYNRQINRDNAFENLRKQFARRKPELICPLGTEDEPVEWATLGLGQKVGILHDLCEWQLEDPARFRGLLKSEDDAVSWRIDPVGWDKEGNTYWLFDDNRLWVQRLPPPPPRPAKKTSQKAKKGSNKRSRPSTTETPAPRKSHKRREPTLELTPSPPPARNEQTVLSGSRRRSQVAFYGNPTPTALALKQGTRGTPASANVGQSGSGSRSTRSGMRNGMQANGHTNGHAATPSKIGRSSSASQSTPLPLGTRVSRRLRNVDDEWQKIPDEWLAGDAELKAKGRGKGKRKERDGDEDSELSELTDEEEHEAIVRAIGARSGSVPDRSEHDIDVAKDDLRDKTVEQNETQEGRDHEKMDIDSVAAKEQPDADEGAIVKRAESQQEPDSAQISPGTSAPEANNHSSPSEAAPGVIAKTEAVPDLEAKVVSAEVPVDVKVDGQANAEDTDEVKIAAEDANTLPEGFVEWEAVCVTLYDWRTFPEQFAKSKDPDEKALYELLTEEVGPKVIEVLVEKEQERIKQELINNRKRSSRIATRELEKEELARREQAEREMEERMEKNRLEEQRKAREEAELLAREKAREERLKEREERAAAREEALAKKAEEEQKIKDKAERLREKRKRRREGEEVSSDEEDEGQQTGRTTGRASRTGTVTPSVGDGKAPGASAGEAWELNCEVCRKTGWNIDDDQDVVCCDECGRWQHVECHDRMDESQGRPKRNWDKVDFKCKECRHRAARKRQRLSGDSSSVSTTPHTNGHHASIPPQKQGRSQSSPHESQPHYFLMPGSAPGPQPVPNASRPTPPSLQPGQYFLPHPHPQRPSDQPAGYTVHYSPRQDSRPPASTTPVVGYPQHSPLASNGHQYAQGHPQHPVVQRQDPVYAHEQHTSPTNLPPIHALPRQSSLPPPSQRPSQLPSQQIRQNGPPPPMPYSPHPSLPTASSPYAAPPHASPHPHLPSSQHNIGFPDGRPYLPPPLISPQAHGGSIQLPPLRSSPIHRDQAQLAPGHSRPSPPHLLSHPHMSPGSGRALPQGGVVPPSPRSVPGNTLPPIAAIDFANGPGVNGHGHDKRTSEHPAARPVSVQQTPVQASQPFSSSSPASKDLPLQTSPARP